MVTIKPSGQIHQITSFRENRFAMLSVDFFFKIIMFYVAAIYLLPVYLSKKQLHTVLKILGLFAGTFLLGILINYTIINYTLNCKPPRSSRLFSLSLLIHFFILLLALAYSLSKERFRTEQLQKEIEEEKLRTELDFLKSQMNPHFLFNTLNNLYAESKRHKNPTLSNGIAKLSHMMRYMLYESNETFVSLSKEIEFLESFIELQMLRISPDDPFEFRKEIGYYDPSIKIAPILFQPIVENAFKYGVKLEEASYVYISLDVHENQLHFLVENSMSTDSRLIEHSGIGLSNIKRRLELLYPDKHTLQIQELADKFTVSLKLQLQKIKQT